MTVSRVGSFGIEVDRSAVLGRIYSKFSALNPRIYRNKIRILALALIIVSAILLAYFISTGSPNLRNSDSTSNTLLNNQQPPDSSVSSGSGVSNSGDSSNTNSQNVKGNQGSTSNNSTSVSVNGQEIKVPQNGPYSDTIKTPNGSVKVSGENSQVSTGGNSSNSSSTTVNIQSP